MKFKNLHMFRGAFALLTLLPLAPRASEASNEPKDQQSDPPTHVLFTGTDIKVLHQGTLCRVRGVHGGSFIIKVKDKDLEVPMGTNPEKLKVSQVQRLTDHSATMANYKYDRAYTAANDPVRKWHKALQTTTDVFNDLRDRAVGRIVATPETTTVPAGPSSGMGPPPMKEIHNPAFEAAEQTLQTNQNALESSDSVNSNSRVAEKVAEELARELFDAVEVQFEVSSAKPIHSPYVVITAKYHEKNDPKYSQNWLFAKALDPIDAKPKKMFIREGGFPPGFIVEKLQVHLYEDGLEIATDLSENRAPLARDEAHEYLVIDHLSTHKTDTLPARVALTKMPEDWATHPKDELYRKTYYVKVDKEGHSVGSFEDEACEMKVANVYYGGFLKDLLFLPALERGKPVESVARVKLTEISM